MSSFLMWSNLVFPLAHLNILISAEFSLLSSFFFTAQHSEPYVIAGLIIVLKTLSFNSTGIFLSHITPDTSFHFIHPILILLLTSACEPPSLVNSEGGSPRPTPRLNVLKTKVVTTGDIEQVTVDGEIV